MFLGSLPAHPGYRVKTSLLIELVQIAINIDRLTSFWALIKRITSFRPRPR